MNIVIFTDTYRPEINGVVTSIDVFRRQLIAEGHAVHLFAPRYFGMDEPDPTIHRLPSIPFPFPMMKERRVVFPTLRAVRTFKKLKPDVIHSQVPGNLGVLALILSWWYRVPHVHTYHTLFIEYTHYMPLLQSFSRRAVVWISRHFCGRCQYIVSPSLMIRDEIRSYGVDAPIAVIPTGIDFDPAREVIPADEIKRRHRMPTDKKLMLYVGRVGREKSIDFLVKVTKKILETRDDVRLVVVGDGPDRPGLVALATKLGVLDAITFTGYVPREEVFSIYAAADVFTFASRTETQGLVLLEAMSVGTPVVAVDAMGVHDLLADGIGGVLSGPSVTEFAAHVTSLLDDRARYETLKRDALRKAETWSVSRMAEKLTACFNESIIDLKRHGKPRFRRRPWYTPETKIPYTRRLRPVKNPDRIATQ